MLFPSLSWLAASWLSLTLKGLWANVLDRSPMAPTAINDWAFHQQRRYWRRNRTPLEQFPITDLLVSTGMVWKLLFFSPVFKGGPKYCLRIFKRVLLKLIYHSLKLGNTHPAEHVLSALPWGLGWSWRFCLVFNFSPSSTCEHRGLMGMCELQR